MHLTGTLLIIAGGVMEGLFSLPVKLTPKWSWENIWGSGSLAALVFAPLPLLWLTVPHFADIYASTPGWTIVATVLFGAGWGLGGIFFGLGVAELGVSLGTSSIMGLIAIGGSVVPFMMQHSGQFLGRKGIALMAGICVMLVGLAVCSRAGNLKSSAEGSLHEGASGSSFCRGLLYCVAAGLLSAMVNFALIYGAPIAQASQARGVPAASANNAVWAIVFAVNYFLNVAYCFYLARKRGTMAKFRVPSTGYYWLLAVLMGLLWAGGIVVYGIGASMGGPYGPVFAFPVMLIVSILTANLMGVLVGEWRAAESSAKHTMQLGVALMVAAIVVLGCANW
jgi:L-rhamnose-H+ transport protein